MHLARDGIPVNRERKRFKQAIVIRVKGEVRERTGRMRTEPYLLDLALSNF